MNQLGRALGYFRPELHRLVLLLFFLVGATGATLLKPWPLALVVDCGLGSEAPPVWLRMVVDPANKGAILGVLAVVVLASHLAQAGLSAALHHVAFQAGGQTLRRVRDELYAQLQRLTGRLMTGARSGDLVHRTTWDTQWIQSLFHQGVVTSLGAVLTLAGIVVLLGRINVVLTLVVVLVIPLLVGVIKYFGPRSTERATVAQQAEGQVTTFLQQSIVSLPLTQAYGREEHEAAAFTSRTAGAAEKRLAQYGWDLGYWLVVGVVFALAMAGLAWLGPQQIVAGRLTLGQWLIFLIYLPMIHEPVRHLVRVGEIFSGAKTGLQRVFEILDAPEEVRESTRPKPVPAALEWELDQVVFGGGRDRDGGTVIWQGLGLRVAAGRTVAVVGASGPGRAALTQLLTRRADPTGGAVRLGGVDVRELALRDLRSRVTVVQVDPIILPVSLAENIAFGKPRAGRKEIEAAARAAGADAFIRALPNGYMTIVGDAGTRLSPSERLQIELARAFLRAAPMLVVDEPGLDPTSDEAGAEAAAAEALATLMKGRTTVVMARRPLTAERADWVVMVRDGRVVEEGAPADLRSRGGPYTTWLSGSTS